MNRTRDYRRAMWRKHYLKRVRPLTTGSRYCSYVHHSQHKIDPFDRDARGWRVRYWAIRQWERSDGYLPVDYSRLANKLTTRQLIQEQLDDPSQ